jgi:hypothetical protein
MLWVVPFESRDTKHHHVAIYTNNELIQESHNSLYEEHETGLMIYVLRSRCLYEGYLV